jgi:hypothetical protein
MQAAQLHFNPVTLGGARAYMQVAVPLQRRPNLMAYGGKRGRKGKRTTPHLLPDLAVDNTIDGILLQRSMGRLGRLEDR